MSAMFDGLAIVSLKMPRPIKRVAPYIMPVESVHPGKGSFAAVAMIEGLKMTIGRL